MPILDEELTEEHKKVKGVSQHGFRAAAEVALAHYEAHHGTPDGPVRVVSLYVTAENPVRDYIVQLAPPGT